MYIILHLKEGHLTNQDKYFDPNGVQIREVPLYPPSVTNWPEACMCIQISHKLNEI